MLMYRMLRIMAVLMYKMLRIMADPLTPIQRQQVCSPQIRVVTLAVQQVHLEEG
jgi:hypothetical protein